MLQLLFDFQVRMFDHILLFQKYRAAVLLEGGKDAPATPGMVPLTSRVVVELEEVRDDIPCLVHGQVSIDLVTHGVKIWT